MMKPQPKRKDASTFKAIDVLRVLFKLIKWNMNKNHNFPLSHPNTKQNKTKNKAEEEGEEEDDRNF